MDVEVKVSDYTQDNKLEFRNVTVRSVFAEGGKAEIEYKGTKFIVAIDEMISALRKCELDCFGR